MGLSYSLLGCSSATLTATPPSPQVRNAGSILFTAAGSGCGVPQHQYWYIAPGCSWTKALDWTSTATYGWNPAAFAPGTYAWVVYGRQQGSGSAYDSYALISFTVT